MVNTGFDVKDLATSLAAGTAGLLAWLFNAIHPAVAAALIALLGIKLRIIWEFYKWYQTDGRRIRRLERENKLLRAQVKARGPRRRSRHQDDIHATDS